MSTPRFRPRKKVSAVYFNIAGESTTWIEANPGCNESMEPAIRAAKTAFYAKEKEIEEKLKKTGILGEKMKHDDT